MRVRAAAAGIAILLAGGTAAPALAAAGGDPGRSAGLGALLPLKRSAAGPVRPPAPVPAPTAAAAGSLDARALPLLERPVLVSPGVATISAASPVVHLDPSRDWVVRVAPGALLSRGAAIVGGRNVVLEDAVLRYAPPAGAPAGWTERGLFLKGQAGTMFVDGLQLRGPLHEGIQLDQKAPGATVVLKRVSIDPVTGSYEGWHADLLQTWAGPARLVVDDFEGTSDYQGMFLRPNQLWADGPRPELFWLRDVRLDVSQGRYALWTDGYGAFPLQTTRVTVRARSADRDAWLWPKPSTGDATWAGVTSVP